MTVEAADSCLNESSLYARVRDYRAGAAEQPALRVHVLQREAALEFVVLQDGQPVARREFPQLPAACDERLDTLALAITVALANATHAPVKDASPTHARAPVARAPNMARTRSENSIARASAAAQAPESRSSGADPSERRTALAPIAAQAPDPGRSGAASGERRAAFAPIDAQEHESGSSGADSGERRATFAPIDAQARELSSPDVDLNAATADESPRVASATPELTSSQRDARATQAPPRAARGSGCCDLGLAAGARYGLQVLPEPVLLFDLGVELGLARLLSLQAAVLASPVLDTAADGGRQRAQITGGELLLCARPQLANVLLRTCAGATAASIGVQGEDFYVDRNARLTWVAGLLRAAVRWPADSVVAAELVLGGHANLVRPTIRVLGSSSPDRVSWLVGGSLGVQLVVTL